MKRKKSILFCKGKCFHFQTETNLCFFPIFEIKEFVGSIHNSWVQTTSLTRSAKGLASAPANILNLWFNGSLQIR